MKFPRNARIFRGRLDVAPFAAVFFLLAIFLLLASLAYTPGVELNLPVGEGLPGTDKPLISVAVDGAGRLYFENQLINESQLRTRLASAVKSAHEPLTLLIEADKSVTYDKLMNLAVLARNAGISSAWLAALPRVMPAPGTKTPPAR